MAAVWSCDPATSLDYPARYLFTFLEHHGMLGVFGSPEWRTVTGGSATYVAAVAAGLAGGPAGDQGDVGARARRRRRGHRRQRRHHPLRRGRGRHAPRPRARDARVAHRPPARGPLRAALQQQPRAPPHRRLAAAHRPRRPRLLELPPPAPEPAKSQSGVTVTYDLTRLQRLPTDTHYLVTLGGEDLVDPASVIDRMEYEHPLYTPASVAASRRLPEINTSTGSPSPGRTTAGASTRTAPARVSRPPPTSACPGSAPRTSCREPGASRPRSATPGAARSGAPSSTTRPSGSSTSTTCPTTACWRGSRRATTSVRPTPRCATTSSRSSPTTVSRSATATVPARS